MPTNNALEARARRAARKAGFIARKSRLSFNTALNRGGFMLTDEQNGLVAGEHFELTAEEVMEFCRTEAQAERG